MPHAHYAVTRLDGTTATVVDDDGKQYAVPAARLPKGVREGVVLRVPIGTRDEPLWGDSTVDDAETTRRRESADGLSA